MTLGAALLRERVLEAPIFYYIFVFVQSMNKVFLLVSTFSRQERFLQSNVFSLHMKNYFRIG